MRLFKVAPLLLLAACANTPKYTWTNPALDSTSAMSQRQIDSAECMVIAMRAVSLPTPPPAPAETNVNVTVGNSMSPTWAHEFQPEGFDVAQYRAEYQHSLEVRTELADACMMKRGWTKTLSVKTGRASDAAATDLAESSESAQATAAPPSPPRQSYDDWRVQSR